MSDVAVPAVATDLAAGALALAVLVASASVAVERLLALATRYDVADVVVGATVLAVGTSLPEVSASLAASGGIVAGTLDPDVAAATVLGGVLGSATLQQTLLVGLLVLGYGRVELSRPFVRVTYLPTLAGFALLLALGLDGSLSRSDGAILLFAFAAATAYATVRRPGAAAATAPASRRPGRDVAVAVGALALVIVSSYAVLAAVTSLVTVSRLGGSTVGVVTLGLAAALPELATVRESVARRTPGLALGTLVGSNLVNPLLALGGGAVVSTYRVPPSVTLWDLPVKLLVGVAILGVVRRSDRSLGRREGFALVGAYLLFLAGRVLLFPGQ